MYFGVALYVLVSLSLLLRVRELLSAFLQNKIQLGKFTLLIGFIQQFMKWTASHLVNRKQLQGTVQNGRLFQKLEGKEGADNKEVISQRKERIVSGQVKFFQGKDKDLSCRLPFLSFSGEEGYMDKAHATDYLIGADQPENPKLAD